MARYPSGISSKLPEPTGDAVVWLARVRVALDEQPLGTSAPCANPECVAPVDYLGGSGPPPLYCSRTCRARASTLRQRAEQQLDVIEALLEETRHRRGVPREELRERASQLRWWLARLATKDERTLEHQQHHSGDQSH